MLRNVEVQEDMSEQNNDDTIHRLYAERVARLIPIDSRGKRVLNFRKMHSLLGQNCKLPRLVRGEFIEELERKGLIVVENRMRISFCDGIGEGR